MTVTARRAALAALATATALGATVLTAPAFAAEPPSAQQQGEASAPPSASADASKAGGAAPKSVEVPPSSEAPKAVPELKEGDLAWGVKQSLRDDIKSGKIKAEGASQAKDNGVFTFAEGKGAYDKSTDSVTATFKGSVHFQGYEDAEHGYKLDVKLSDLTVVTAAKGKTGEIRATVTKGSNAPKTVAIATLEYVEHTAREGVHAFKKIPAKLTAAGAEAFTHTGDEKPYKVGDELDSLDFSVKPPTTDQAGDGASQDGGDKSKGKDDKDNKGKDSKGKAGVELFDGNLDWGLSETFRKYIDNTSGQAVTSSGAQSFKGGYRFSKGKGSYDATNSSLNAKFAGEVRFTARGGDVDLKLTDLQIDVEGKAGTITATSNRSAKPIPLAKLALSGDFPKVKDGVVTLSAVPATLTEAGAKAFKFKNDQILKEGDALDPLTVAVATDKNAKLPDAPSGTGSDKSSDTTTSTGTTATNTTSTTGGTGSTTGGTTTDTTASGSLASTGANTPTGPLLGGAAALIAVGGGAVYAARRRKAGQQG
ncbi:HtaA domain-containing protein [Streptomyces olivoreticuli]|uniref:HtaA domain-containing protein n=1 Tax=Streptomyces olivoreticuli TaxID=68246 RepID=UPI00265B0F3D|nr:HtaA domain-containing protein [Streptomyces olivoreticuli]WKK22267.1 HtaA domain-containing protein [Streptomyces olivoreticuli]